MLFLLLQVRPPQHGISLQLVIEHVPSPPPPPPPPPDKKQYLLDDFPLLHDIPTQQSTSSTQVPGTFASAWQVVGAGVVGGAVVGADVVGEAVVVGGAVVGGAVVGAGVVGEGVVGGIVTAEQSRLLTPSSRTTKTVAVSVLLVPPVGL